MPDLEQEQTILVVDDEPVIRKLLAALLANLGTVELAASGEEALRKALALKPDLIVLDVQMPGLDGYEVGKRLKATVETSFIPIVFLTANITNEEEERGLEIGATDFIRKPISANIVRTRVGNILKFQAATQKLELLASTDPLTGAYNRRHFMETGYNELLRSKRYKHTFTVLMLDIDHFKAVNDTHGHNIGDEALIQTVAVIQQTLRAEDIMARLGGEEFAVLLPETEKAKGALLAERIRVAISEIVVETPTTPLTFTMSIGISESTDADTDIDDALKRADDALYQAKERGRNQVA
ncbi:MAG: diguanylate cyclase [Rhodospirillales bacterium]|nr:diguanylate cyclase [Rhodospirillales bacterium]